MNHLLAALCCILFALLIAIVTKYKDLEKKNLRLRLDVDNLRFDNKFNITALEASFAKRLEEQKEILEGINEDLKNSAYKNGYREGEKFGRKDALARSKAVNHGFTSENFAPLLAGDWNHKDFRHMGDPIDYLVVSGMENVRHGPSKTPVDEVVLLDIKTGNASLNKIQRRIRDAIVAGRVRFATFNTDTSQVRYWPPKPEVDSDGSQLQLDLVFNDG